MRSPQNPDAKAVVTEEIGLFRRVLLQGLKPTLNLPRFLGHKNMWYKPSTHDDCEQLRPLINKKSLPPRRFFILQYVLLLKRHGKAIRDLIF